MSYTSSEETAQNLSERRSGSRQLAQKMTTERSEMLTLFCRVAGLEPYQEADRGEIYATVQEFCQVLVDYVAAGHFLLYERIVSGQERRKELAKLAERVYDKISDTTEIALDFNDKYDSDNSWVADKGFDADLSRLGEALAQRIELEDQLIEAMVTKP